MDAIKRCSEILLKHDNWYPWWSTVIARLESGLPPTLERLSKLGTNRTRNVDYGIRVNFGRRQGHTTLAQIIAQEFDNVAVVVPTETGGKRFVKPDKKLLSSKLWVSRPLDIVPQEESGWVRSDVVNKRFAPLLGATVCVVDGASGMALDELELLRAADWQTYIELS